MMKRGDAEVAPAHLERVRRTPQWGGSGKAVADCQALSMGGTALLCLVKMFRHGVFFAAVLLPPLGATLHAMLVRAGLWAAVYVV